MALRMHSKQKRSKVIQPFGLDDTNWITACAGMTKV
jgi:hypothetical protein